MGLPVEASTGCAFIISPGPPQAPRPSLLELETAGNGREILLGTGSEGQDGLVQVTQLSVAKPGLGPETGCRHDAMPYPSQSVDGHGYG